MKFHKRKIITTIKLRAMHEGGGVGAGEMLFVVVISLLFFKCIPEPRSVKLYSEVCL